MFGPASGAHRQVLASTIGTAWVTDRTRADAALVEHTFRIELLQGQVKKLMVDADTGKELSLQANHNARMALPKALEDMQEFLVNERQLQRVKELEPLIHAKLDELAETIELRKLAVIGASLAELSAAVEEHEAIAAVVEISTTGESNASSRQVSEQSGNTLFRASGALDAANAGGTKVQATLLGVQNLEELAEQSKTASRATAEAFELIANAMHSVVESSQQASLNVRQQRMAVSQVTEAMVSLSNGSRQTSAGIAQTRVGLVDIKGSTQELGSIT